MNILSTVKQPLTKETILVTVDVTSLYTNIPHDKGMESVKQYLNQRPVSSTPSADFIIKLIEFILTMNAFKFNNNFYLQRKGTAMGTRMAPSYANIFMGSIESNFLRTQAYIPTLWCRYIDDIFFIWNHTVDHLEQFLNNLNSFSCLKFTWNYSRETITFLDVDVFIESGQLKSKIHTKNTNSLQYLNYSSCHPTYVKKSIPKGLSVRAKSLCTDKSDFDNYIIRITNSFKTLGYSEKLLKSQISKPKNQSVNNSFNNDPKFITKFYPGLNKINYIMKTAFNILESSPDTKNLFSKPPRVIFKNPPNLKNLIVQTDVSKKFNIGQPSPTSGCQPCKKPRCGTCSILESAKEFKSTATNKNYPIKGHIDCNTKNVIYQLNCKMCDKQYIGQTSNHLRIRMTGHRFDIFHNDKTKPVANHAKEHNANKIEQCFSLKGIQKVQDKKDENINRFNLNRCEYAHQMVLKTRFPQGLNLR